MRKALMNVSVSADKAVSDKVRTGFTGAVNSKKGLSFVSDRIGFNGIRTLSFISEIPESSL